jgi:predicted N-formylglutamate amidohydrolase
MTSPFILSVHSFTPSLVSDPHAERPWDIGVLYNGDDRAARIAIPLLSEAGLLVGDQLPYSGKLLNATMNRHAEGNGIPYLGVEMRQDLVAEADGQRRFASIIGPIVLQCRNSLA